MSLERISLAVAPALDALVRQTPPPSRADVDRVLTDGYAEALEIEANRLLLSRRLADETARAGEAGGADEILRLNQELLRETQRLVALRKRLAEASRRFGRNPLADDAA